MSNRKKAYLLTDRQVQALRWAVTGSCPMSTDGEAAAEALTQPLPDVTRQAEHEWARRYYKAPAPLKAQPKLVTDGSLPLPKAPVQPKLDRKTRGQVRRVTNRLNTVERREFPSRSNPSKSYTAVVYTDGKVLCNCQGWTMKKEGKARQCKHTRELIAGRPTIDDGEHLFLKERATAHHAPTSGMHNPVY